MAVITCPECQGKVSDAAVACPHCGYPVNHATVAQAAASVRQAAAVSKAEQHSIASVALTESEIWFSYKGRISVGQYWGRLLIAVAGLFAVAVALGYQADTATELETFEGFLVFLYFAWLWPASALAWKRAHDTGRNGASFLLILIPLAGPIIWLVFSLQQSASDPNQYGPRPGFRYNQ